MKNQRIHTPSRWQKIRVIPSAEGGIHLRPTAKIANIEKDIEYPRLSPEDRKAIQPLIQNHAD